MADYFAPYFPIVICVKPKSVYGNSMMMSESFQGQRFAKCYQYRWHSSFGDSFTLLAYPLVDGIGSLGNQG